jgi:hypothetical protein
MKTLKQLREEAHQKLLEVRNVYTTVNLSRFEEAYSYADQSQKEVLCLLVERHNQEALIKLIERIIFECAEIESLSMKDLRIIAQKCRILHYNFLPKASLISAIKQYEQSNKIIRRNGTTFIESRNKENIANKSERLVASS